MGRMGPVVFWSVSLRCRCNIQDLKQEKFTITTQCDFMIYGRCLMLNRWIQGGFFFYIVMIETKLTLSQAKWLHFLWNLAAKLRE